MLSMMIFLLARLSTVAVSKAFKSRKFQMKVPQGPVIWTEAITGPKSHQLVVEKWKSRSKRAEGDVPQCTTHSYSYLAEALSTDPTPPTTWRFDHKAPMSRL